MSLCYSAVQRYRHQESAPRPFTLAVASFSIYSPRAASCHPLFKMLANHCSMIDGSISEISPADERNQDPLTSLPQRAMGKPASESSIFTKGRRRAEDGRTDAGEGKKIGAAAAEEEGGSEALNPGNTHVVRPANRLAASVSRMGRTVRRPAGRRPAEKGS